jgi:hypothetical protein
MCLVTLCSQCELTTLRAVYMLVHYYNWSRDSVVGIATRYGLEGPGIESRWGEIFRTYPDRLRGPPSLLYNGHRAFPGGKGSRSVMLTTPPSSTEVKKELSHTSNHPMGLPGPVTGFPLSLLHYYYYCYYYHHHHHRRHCSQYNDI